MPFNGSGTFTVLNTFIPNTTILSASVNANFTDIATGLSNCLTRDGQAGMTAAFKAISGSAGAPSITFTADATTGMYLISAGNLGLTSSGVLGFTLNSSQVGQFAQSASGKVFLIPDSANASTTTASLATAATGALAVSSTTNWNTNGYLQAGNEIISYTVASAAGITVNSRGELGTTAAAHATATTLTMLFSGIAKNDFPLPPRATAGRPTAPIPGSFGFNTTLAQPEYYSGTTWVSTANPQLTPQGYLSTVSGTPIVTADSTSQTTIFYNPFVGNLIPIPTTGIFALTSFSTASVALSASQTTAGIYDIYGFISTTNSTLTFGISPSWAAGTSGSVVPGSCARGTGAGGTQLTRTNGLYVNTTTMTILNGASSYSIATASGVYLGSVYIGATAGTVNLHRNSGQSRQWGVWNAFNRVPLYLSEVDSTATWNASTTGFSFTNATAVNSITSLAGLQEETVNIEYEQVVSIAANNQVWIYQNGIGVNVSNAASGTVGQFTVNVGALSLTQRVGVMAKYVLPPSLGVNTINAIEATPGAGSSGITSAGTIINMQMIARWTG